MAIACCLCGELMEPNETNTCLGCETRKAQAKASAPLAGALNRCHECRRVQLRGGKRPWHAYAPQSLELQRLCLQSVAELGKDSAKLLDAQFAPQPVPDERVIRLQLRLGVTAGDFELQVEREAVIAVENVVCADCDHEVRGWSWRAFVQLRFNSEYPRAFYRLEQELLKSKAVSDGMAVVKGGVDVCFASKPAAEKFVQQVTALAPVRTKTSSKTRSTDLSQHTANVQTTYCLELCPIAKHDLVVLPKKLAQALGSPQIVLCAQTTSQLHLVDPSTGKRFELSRDKYWLNEFVPWQTSAHLEDFVVLDVDEPERSSSGGQSARDVQVARVRDFGVNDSTFLVHSHLADSLQVGDRVKGYDLTTANMSVRVFYTLNGREVPEVVLVRPTASPDDDEADSAAERQPSVEIKRLVEDDGGKKARSEARDFEAFAADYADELLLAA